MTTFRQSHVVVVAHEDRTPLRPSRKLLTSYQKRMHDTRRAKKVCINNESHGPAVKGGRCQVCWEIKISGERSAYAAGRRKKRPHAALEMPSEPGVS